MKKTILIVLMLISVKNFNAPQYPTNGNFDLVQKLVSYNQQTVRSSREYTLIIKHFRDYLETNGNGIKYLILNCAINTYDAETKVRLNIAPYIEIALPNDRK